MRFEVEQSPYLADVPVYFLAQVAWQGRDCGGHRWIYGLWGTSGAQAIPLQAFPVGPLSEPSLPGVRTGELVTYLLDRSGKILGEVSCPLLRDAPPPLPGSDTAQPSDTSTGFPVSISGEAVEKISRDLPPGEYTVSIAPYISDGDSSGPVPDLA